MPFRIIRDDITRVKADAIVNSANPQPIYASGTDAAIYRAAGAEALLAERRKIGTLLPGQVASTPAFALPAKYILHTVGPVWVDGAHGELATLSACYRGCLELAEQLGCESIAFPMIATGVYGFPKDKALDTAISVISKFLLESELEVILVVFHKRSFQLSGKIFKEVDAFIDDQYVEQKQREEYGTSDYRRTAEYRRRMALYNQELSDFSESMSLMEPSILQAPTRLKKRPSKAESAPKTLDEMIAQAGDSFQQRLFRLIDEKGMEDKEVYKAANISKQTFSKIKCNAAYTPKKNTILALAVAMQLDLEQTVDLLSRAGLALAPNSKSDLIVQFFIKRREYNLYQINMSLFDHDLPTLTDSNLSA